MPAANDKTAQRAARIEEIESLLALFVPPSQILRDKMEEWGLARRTVQEYLTDAKLRLEAPRDRRTAARRRRIIKANEALVGKAVGLGQCAAAKGALIEVARLEGLHDRSPEDDDDE